MEYIRCFNMRAHNRNEMVRVSLCVSLCARCDTMCVMVWVPTWSWSAADFSNGYFFLQRSAMPSIRFGYFIFIIWYHCGCYVYLSWRSFDSLQVAAAVSFAFAHARAQSLTTKNATILELMCLHRQENNKNLLFLMCFRFEIASFTHTETFSTTNTNASHQIRRGACVWWQSERSEWRSK